MRPPRRSRPGALPPAAAAPRRRTPAISSFTLAERPDRRGDRGPPRAGRHPDGLVQGRLGRRAAGPVRHRAFPRAPDVQGAPTTLADGEFSRIVAANGGDDNAFTSTDYTAYFQRIAADRLDLVHGHGGRPHGQPRPDAAGGALPSATWCSRSAGRWWRTTPDGPFGEQRRAALYLNHPYRPAGDRLASTRSRRFDRDEGDGLLPRPLRAEQRHPGGRRRRRPGRGRAAGGEALRPDPRLGRRAAAHAPAGAAAARPRGGSSTATPRVREPYVCRAATSRRSAGRATRREAAALDGAGRAARRLGHHLGDGAGAGARRRHRARRRRLLRRCRRSIRRASALYVVPKPGVSLAEAEAALDALIARFLEDGPGPGAARRASRPASAPPRSTRSTTSTRRARRVGAALTSGLTLEDVAGLARAAAGGHAPRTCRRPPARSSAPRPR